MSFPLGAQPHAFRFIALIDPGRLSGGDGGLQSGSGGTKLERGRELRLEPTRFVKLRTWVQKLAMGTIQFK